jgi:hypothetical protein
LDRSDQCISPSLFHETPEHTNRVIAKMLGVSHPTVSSVRSDLTSVGNLFQQERRVGADEKAYKASLSAVTWKQLPKLVSWINGASKVIGIDREATFLRTARERISNG